MIKNKRLFIVAMSAASLNVALLARAIGDVQLGPYWEVPYALASRLANMTIYSIGFDIVIIVCYFAGRGFRSHPLAQRVLFLVIAGLGIFLTVVAWTADTENWRNSNPFLSELAKSAEIPIMVACGILWLVAVFRQLLEVYRELHANEDNG